MRSGASGEIITDAQGGFPGRLQKLLGDSVEVRNRGIGGATSDVWLQTPDDPIGKMYWGALQLLYPDSGLRAEPRKDASIFAATLASDAPDLVVVLLGVNDIAPAQHEASKRLPGPADLDVDLLADEVGKRLQKIAAQARASGAKVLVSTLPPNRRYPAAARDRINDRIRAAFPDHLPLGEAVAASPSETLSADNIHLNESAYEIMARTLGDELVRRGLVPATAKEHPPKASPAPSG